MADASHSNWKTWLPVLAFVGQGVATIWYAAQSNERTVIAVQHLQEQVRELKTNNQLLAQVVTEIAVLKVKVATLESFAPRYEGDRRGAR